MILRFSFGNVYKKYKLILKKKLDFKPSGDADCFAHAYYDSLTEDKSITSILKQGEKCEK